MFVPGEDTSGVEEGVVPQKVKKVTVNLSNSLPKEFQNLLQEHFPDNSAGSVVDQLQKLNMGEKKRQTARTEQREESPASSPARIAAKYSDVSELDQSRENPGEAIDKKCKPGRDIEIDDYIGSPTLRPHLLPKNKAGQFPSWYDSDDISTLSVPGGELEDPVPQRSTNSDFDRLLEATQKRQPKQSITPEEQQEQNPTVDSPNPGWIREGSVYLFENHHNMCFATTSLHCLLQLKPFRDAIMTNATNATKSGEVGEICQLVLEAQKDPRNFLTDIIQKCNLQVGKQSDAEEFLQLLLQKTEVDLSETVRRVEMTCIECQKKTVQLEEKLVLLVPILKDETENLQAELGKLCNGTTNHECPSNKCRKKKTIHQVLIIKSIVPLFWK